MLTIKSTGEANKKYISIRCRLALTDVEWWMSVVHIVAERVWKPKQFHITYGHEIHHCQCLKMEESS